MNWAVYSEFVGDVFGAARDRGPRRLRLEATFLGCGSSAGTGSPGLHLATLWIAVAGSWLSAYFILVATPGCSVRSAMR